MIEIYGEFCWMNYLWIPSKKNELTFHHIKEARYGGKYIIGNGALLSLRAHQYLNTFDNKEDRKIYRELNELFYELNRSFAPPTEEHYNNVSYVLSRVKHY